MFSASKKTENTCPEDAITKFHRPKSNIRPTFRHGGIDDDDIVNVKVCRPGTYARDELRHQRQQQ
jgi:hypothetical protein